MLVALKAKRINIVQKEKTKIKVLTRACCFDSKPLVLIVDRYTGKSGSMHGEKKETRPASRDNTNSI
tara:strand:- start:1530 stop:1730 length:201 start_codon:yes stop_codon:yes gene_type:complete